MSIHHSPDKEVHEIIIVKRHSDHEDGHHGGVWKIAFADFMTAMMCFFLVMWLINAANEETKVAVASYFNPIKLVDRNSSKRGLDDVGAGPQEHDASSETDAEDDQSSRSQGPAESGSSSEKTTTSGDEQDKASDQHLFTDPFAVLAEIAAESGEAQNVSQRGDGGAQVGGPATGASGGESYRDPFAPDFWSKQIEPPEAMETNPFNQPPKPQAVEGLAEGIVDPPPPVPNADGELFDDVFAAQARQQAPAPTQDAALAEALKAAAAAGKTSEDGEAGEKPAGGTGEGSGATGPTAAELEAQAIREEIAKVFGTSERIADGLSVTATDRGVLVSLTDQLDYGMFEIGSAVPRRDLVLALEKIGRILEERKGAISVNGHTDGRPFRSDTYDNWRLSTARAHSAYYMLVRGGLDERRVVEVSGFADRKLRIPENPQDDTNRRIEIFLEAGG